MCCIIKCIVQGKQACVKNTYASSVLHSCSVKTQICVTRPQCVKVIEQNGGNTRTAVQYIHFLTFYLKQMCLVCLHNMKRIFIRIK